MAHKKSDERDLIRQLERIVEGYPEVRTCKTVRLTKHTAFDIVLTNGKGFRHICNPNPMNRLNNLRQFERSLKMLTNPIYSDNVHAMRVHG